MLAHTAAPRFVATAPVCKAQRLPRRALVARASAEKPAEEQAPTASGPSSPLPNTTPVVKTPQFGDVMAFSGAAPEIVNGRLAMLGFTAALGAELASQESVFAQLAEPGAASWTLYAFFLFIGASLIPIFKGTKSEAFGPFSPKAELLNGRAAMIGFAALLAIEAAKGSALF